VQAVADRRGRILDTLPRAGGGGWDVDGRHLISVQMDAQSMMKVMRVPVSGAGRLGRGEEMLGRLRQDEVTGFAMTPTGYVLGSAGRTADVWAFAVGGAARRLTHGSTWYVECAISPDGKTVAYVKQDAWGTNLYTIPAAGGMEAPVTSDSGLRQRVAWLNDERRLSDLALTGGASVLFRQEVVDPETGRVRTVPLEPGLAIVEWRPDGSALAMQVDGHGVAVVDSAGKTLSRVALPDSVGALESGALAPDGRSAVALAVGRRTYQAYLMRLDDSSVRVLANLGAADSVHVQLQTWGRDGFIYFSRLSGDGAPELWRMPQAGGAPRRVAALPAGCDQTTVSLSRDARAGACLMYDNRPDLWLVERK